MSAGVTRRLAAYLRASASSKRSALRGLIKGIGPDNEGCVRPGREGASRGLGGRPTGRGTRAVSTGSAVMRAGVGTIGAVEVVGAAGSTGVTTVVGATGAIRVATGGNIADGRSEKWTWRELRRKATAGGTIVLSTGRASWRNCVLIHIAYSWDLLIAILYWFFEVDSFVGKVSFILGHL
jgi:hypothetical protein